MMRSMKGNCRSIVAWTHVGRGRMKNFVSFIRQIKLNCRKWWWFLSNPRIWRGIIREDSSFAFKKLNWISFCVANNTIFHVFVECISHSRAHAKWQVWSDEKLCDDGIVDYGIFEIMSMQPQCTHDNHLLPSTNSRRRRRRWLQWRNSSRARIPIHFHRRSQFS